MGIPSGLRSPRARAWLLPSLGLILMLLGAGPQGAGLPLVQVTLGKQTLLAEVPLSYGQKYRGLGGREGLLEGRGMLFIFQPAQRVTMSMRGMRFALDFIWGRAGRVVQITPDVPPWGAAWLLRSEREVDLVLEVPAGWSAARGVRVGDPVRVRTYGLEAPPALQRLLDRLAKTEAGQ